MNSGLIARSWSCRTPLRHADGFHRHLLETGVADYRNQPGCREVCLLRRDSGDIAHFMLLSFWESMDAIRAYAGEKPEIAVLYDGDEAYGLDPDLFVSHYGTIATSF